MFESCLSPGADYQCIYSLQLLWYHIDWVRRLDLFLLLGMLFYIAISASLGFYRYHLARHQLRGLRRHVGLRDSFSESVMKAASRSGRGPVAIIVAAGLTAFAEAPAGLAETEAIHLARRASERALSRNRAYFSLGINSLRSISVTAPLLGLFGTCLGVLDSFSGVGMQKAAAIAFLLSSLGAAPITTAAGLLVVVPAIFAYNYLLLCRESIEQEITDVTLTAITCMGAHRALNSKTVGASDGAAPKKTRLRETVRLSQLPSFALMAVPVMVCGIVGFMIVTTYRRPVGLDVQLRDPLPAIPKDRSCAGTIVQLETATNGQVALYVNSRRISVSTLDSKLRDDLKTRSQSIVYVGAGNDVQWKEVATVIDVLHGLADHVVLLPTHARIPCARATQ